MSLKDVFGNSDKYRLVLLDVIFIFLLTCGFTLEKSVKLLEITPFFFNTLLCAAQSDHLAVDLRTNSVDIGPLFKSSMLR